MAYIKLLVHVQCSSQNLCSKIGLFVATGGQMKPTATLNKTTDFSGLGLNIVGNIGDNMRADSTK